MKNVATFVLAGLGMFSGAQLSMADVADEFVMLSRPTIELGSERYHFHALTPSAAVCRAMGYRSWIAGTTKVEKDYWVNVVRLTPGATVMNMADYVEETQIVTRIGCRWPIQEESGLMPEAESAEVQSTGSVTVQAVPAGVGSAVEIHGVNRVFGVTRIVVTLIELTGKKTNGEFVVFGGKVMWQKKERDFEPSKPVSSISEFKDSATLRNLEEAFSESVYAQNNPKILEKLQAAIAAQGK